MRQLFPIRMLRGLLVAVGLIAAVLAALTYTAPGLHGAPPNPYATEFGADLHAWAVLCIVATVAFAIAIFLSRGFTRWAICLLLVLTWWSDITPARHYIQYFYDARGGAR